MTYVFCLQAGREKKSLKNNNKNCSIYWKKKLSTSCKYNKQRNFLLFKIEVFFSFFCVSAYIFRALVFIILRNMKILPLIKVNCCGKFTCASSQLSVLRLPAGERNSNFKIQRKKKEKFYYYEKTSKIKWLIIVPNLLILIP